MLAAIAKDELRICIEIDAGRPSKAGAGRLFGVRQVEGSVLTAKEPAGDGRFQLFRLTVAFRGVNIALDLDRLLPLSEDLRSIRKFG